MRVLNDVRAGDHELLRAAVVLDPTVVLSCQVAAVQIRAVRPANHENPLLERLVKRLYAFVQVGHRTLNVSDSRRATGNHAMAVRR